MNCRCHGAGQSGDVIPILRVIRLPPAVLRLFRRTFFKDAMVFLASFDLTRMNYARPFVSSTFSPRTSSPRPPPRGAVAMKPDQKTNKIEHRLKIWIIWQFGVRFSCLCTDRRCDHILFMSVHFSLHNGSNRQAETGGFCRREDARNSTRPISERQGKRLPSEVEDIRSSVDGDNEAETIGGPESEDDGFAEIGRRSTEVASLTIRPIFPVSSGRTAPTELEPVRRGAGAPPWPAASSKTAAAPRMEAADNGRCAIRADGEMKGGQRASATEPPIKTT
ncbi:hypothetical protein EYF80_036539 [Liparis tanakae]|uniref:Uncharacterized protein n=1 Tax=Liparis tanakae TaxID=230148 RepID=A0A4Z2GI68_9TELE|nr:hypothetical protein EYF80_036539 [Liparis tanakae]